MNWVPTALVLMTITLLIVQGIVLLARSRRSASPEGSQPPPPQTFLVGVVNMFLAVFAVMAFFLFASGALLLSPEYGALFAQGRLAWLWAIAIIAGVTVGLAWLLHGIRVMLPLPSSPVALIGGGCAVTLTTVWRAKVLNLEELSEFRIRCVDLWSYFFLAWVVALLTLWILIVVYKNAMPWRRRLLGVVFALSLCGLMATLHASVGLTFVDSSWTLRLWLATTWIGVPFVMSVVTWSSIRKRRPNWPKAAVPVLTAVVLVAGLFTTFEWTQYVDGGQSWTQIKEAMCLCMVIWGIWTILLSILPIIDWFLRARQTAIAKREKTATAETDGVVVPPAWPGKPMVGETLRQLPEVIQDALRKVPDIGTKGKRGDDAVALVCFAIIAGSIVDLSHSARLDPIWDLAALIMSWLVLSEILAVYPLCRFMKDKRKVFREDENYLRSAAKKLWGVMAWLMTPLRWFVRADPADGAVKVTLFAAGKLALFIAIVIAITQLPNAGKTVVLPFTSTDLDAKAQDKGDGQEGSKELGRLVSDRVVNTIGVVGRDVEPLLLVTNPKDQKDAVWIPTSSNSNTDVQAAFANSSMEISDTKIPLIGVVTSIQEMARWVLRVRQISGSVQRQGDNYVLLASSSAGDTWRVTQPEAVEQGRRSAAVEEAAAKKKPGAKGATSGTAGKRSQPEQGKAGARSSAAQGTAEGQAPADVAVSLSDIEQLADNLAHKIIASDKRLQDLGMTSVPKAMPDFSAGVEEWRRFETGDEDALAESITHLHNAVSTDPQFSAAYYRLGQAYLSDGQPRAAANAFRESVRTNPGFIAGRIALAETLYYLPNSYYPKPAGLNPQSRVTPYSEESRESDQDEAHKELEIVIRELQPSLTVTWRAAAYTGLCRVAFERHEQRKTQISRYTAFFYCRRAQYLYSHLPAAIASTPQVKNNEVFVLAILGQLLNPYDEMGVANNTASEPPKPDDEHWPCDPAAVNEVRAHIEKVPYNTYLKASQRYYELALSKAPDDAYLRCKYARVLTVDGNNEQMSGLVNNEQAHIQMADILQDKAADNYEEGIKLFQLAAEAKRAGMGEEAKQAIDSAQNKLKAVKTGYAAVLNEVGRAIDLAPFDSNALNMYAYYTWEWYWAALRFDFWARSLDPALLKAMGETSGPSHAHMDNAGRCAKWAAHITEDKGQRADHGMFVSSLGEVELGAAQFDEAYKTLLGIFYPGGPSNDQQRKACIGHRALYDEIRWDFAQAATCASNKSASASVRNKLRDEFLATIQQHEETREDSRFSKEMLDVPTLQRQCSYFRMRATITQRKPEPNEVLFPRSF